MSPSDIGRLESITDESGVNIGTKAYRPTDLYDEVRNVAPDLLIYFGDLDWRSVGTVGGGELITYENDTGPDDANHAQHGIFIMHDPDEPGGGVELPGLQIIDVAPTVLRRMGLAVPDDMQGKVILP